MPGSSDWQRLRIFLSALLTLSRRTVYRARLGASRLDQRRSADRTGLCAKITNIPDDGSRPMYLDPWMWRRFPAACRHIGQSTRLVIGHSERFAKFMRHARLSEVSAHRALIPGARLPYVKCRELIGAAGTYSSRWTLRGPAPGDRVYLDSTLLRQFERAAGRGPSHEFHNLGFGLYVAIVHEIVHWGADRLGHGGFWEEGEAWEEDVFGRNIKFYFNRWSRRYRIA